MIVLRRTFFKWIVKRNGEVLNHLKKLEAEQWADQKTFEKTQRKRLRSLLTHAYQYVPYYQHAFATMGIKTSDFDSPYKVLEKMPILGKETLREKFEDLKSKDIATRSWFEETSGGSTGEPSRFVQDINYSQWRDAVKLLFDAWTGYRLSSPKMAIWGSERDLMGGKKSLSHRLFRWSKNQTAFNAYHMSGEKMEACIEYLNKRKPVLILAYAESIYELAVHIERKGVTVHRPQAIMTSAGILSPQMRERIERVFGSTVFNRYGSREVGDIACECEFRSGLHVSTPTHYIEILKADGSCAAAGETGEIIVTLLSNYAMPLIRYRIGDVGIWSESYCNCGRKWPMLKKVIGRVTDNFTKKDGTLVYGAFFRHLLFYKNWIKKYQIIQEDVDLIRFKIVPDTNFSDWEAKSRRDIAEVEEGVRKVMGGDCRTEFSFVDQIFPSPSGKYLYTLSKIKPGLFRSPTISN